MSFKIQSNFDRKQSNHDLTNTSMNISNPLTNNNFKDEVIIENFRKLVKEYLELVCLFFNYSLFQIKVLKKIF
jgi:hypothetical protein